MACQCVVVVEEYCEWNDVCDSLISWFCVVCCLFVIRINANVGLNEIVWMPDLLRPPVWVCGGNLCLPKLATSGLQYRESGSPIVQQISRYGRRYAKICRYGGSWYWRYRHMSSAYHQHRRRTCFATPESSQQNAYCDSDVTSLH